MKEKNPVKAERIYSKWREVKKQEREHPLSHEIRKLCLDKLMLFPQFIEVDRQDKLRSITLNTSDSITETARLTTIVQYQREKPLSDIYIWETTDAGQKWIFMNKGEIAVMFVKVGRLPMEELPDLDNVRKSGAAEAAGLKTMSLEVVSAARPIDKQEFWDLKTNIILGKPVDMEEKQVKKIDLGLEVMQTAFEFFKRYSDFVQNVNNVQILRLERSIEGEPPIILNLFGDRIDSLVINCPDLRGSLIRYKFRWGKVIEEICEYEGDRPFESFINEGVFNMPEKDFIKYPIILAKHPYSQKLIEILIENLLESEPYKTEKSELDPVYLAYIEDDMDDDLW